MKKRAGAAQKIYWKNVKNLLEQSILTVFPLIRHFSRSDHMKGEKVIMRKSNAQNAGLTISQKDNCKRTAICHEFNEDTEYIATLLHYCNSQKFEQLVTTYTIRSSNLNSFMTQLLAGYAHKIIFSGCLFVGEIQALHLRKSNNVPPHRSCWPLIWGCSSRRSVMQLVL